MYMYVNRCPGCGIPGVQLPGVRHSISRLAHLISIRPIFTGLSPFLTLDLLQAFCLVAPAYNYGVCLRLLPLSHRSLPSSGYIVPRLDVPVVAPEIPENAMVA